MLAILCNNCHIFLMISDAKPQFTLGSVTLILDRPFYETNNWDIIITLEKPKNLNMDSIEY